MKTGEGGGGSVNGAVGGLQAASPVRNLHDAGVAEQLCDKGAVVKVVADGHAQPVANESVINP